MSLEYLVFPEDKDVLNAPMHGASLKGLVLANRGNLSSKLLSEDNSYRPFGVRSGGDGNR